MQLHHDGLSRPLEAPRLRLLSMGAGVQTLTMAEMAEAGDLGAKPDAMVFADTEGEPDWVYRQLDWIERRVSFPLIRITKGNLEADLLAGLNSTGQRYASIPAFVEGEDGRTAAVRRQCTREYKLDPIIQHVRGQLGLKPRQRGPKEPVVEVWIGFTTDELVRISPSRKRYIQNRFPLIEARMSRRDCERWMAERQLPVPRKSACVFCPYRSNAEWLDLRETEPESFARAVAIDQAIRHGNPGKLRTKRQALHRSLAPLESIDFTAPTLPDALGFGFDCFGGCGL